MRKDKLSVKCKVCKSMHCSCFLISCFFCGEFYSLRAQDSRNWVFATNSNFRIPFFAIWWCKPLINQTKIIWSNKIYSLKCQRSTKFGCKDIGIRNQSLCALKTNLSRTLEKYLNYRTYLNYLYLNCLV